MSASDLVASFGFVRLRNRMFNGCFCLALVLAVTIVLRWSSMSVVSKCRSLLQLTLKGLCTTTSSENIDSKRRFNLFAQILMPPQVGGHFLSIFASFYFLGLVSLSLYSGEGGIEVSH